MGKASTRAHNKYNAKAYDRINLTVAKGQKENIQAHATAHGESVNGFIGRAIVETMERDGADGPQEAAGAAAGTGGVSLSPDALDAAQQAAERTGEAVGEFLARAAQAQAKRDEISLHMGLNPATGDKLDSKGGADHE